MQKSTVRRITNRFSKLSAPWKWNTSIREAVSQRQPQEAVSLFRQMKNSSINPNHLTFPFIAKSCAMLSNLKFSEIIHTHVVKSPYYASDKFVQTALVDMYLKCTHLRYACAVFEEMLDRDVASWNVMLSGLVKMGDLSDVLLLFHRMRVDGIRPDSVTVMALSPFASAVGDGVFLSSVHCFGIRVRLDADVSVVNTWVASYAKCGDLGMAGMVFDGIFFEVLSVVSWNSLITGSADAKESCKAVGIYRRMVVCGFRPDLSTILNVLASFVKPEDLSLGKLFHCHGIQLGCVSDVSVLNTLVSMYSRCGDVNSARRVFDNMMERTRVSWTAIIGGYCENGDLKEALSLFHAMELGLEKPDLVTVVYLVSACGQTGALDIGRWLEYYASSKGLHHDVMVCNALVDMYVKCGSIKDAEKVFLTMPERTVVSWTAMIAGYALNGASAEALDHFHSMLELGLRPNQVTFLAVLQACAHAGLVDKGKEYFDTMTKSYKLEPSLNHYACMADLLGRQGKLTEALEFIQRMPVQPDAGVWGSLLSACKIHKNVEVGESAARHLFEVEPDSAAPYVEMANIYASVGRWDGVAEVRSRMKQNQVNKFPGQSKIQVNGKSYRFTAEDFSHSESLLIFEALQGLSFLLKDEIDSSCSEHKIFNLRLLK